MSYALEIRNLSKNFTLPFSRKKVNAVDDLSFAVHEGGITGFLGANGAGKTTTLKSVLGLIFPDQGEIKIFGQSNLDTSVREKIGFLTERPYFYDYLSGREFLKFCAGLFSDPQCASRIDGLLEEVGLSHAADRPLRRYSKGMLQRVGIAQALINKPQFIILDEPMSGLDPDGRAEISKIISNAHKKGSTILFSSHILSDVESLCDRVVMIHKGKLVVESKVSDLLATHTAGYVVESKSKSDIEKKVLATESELQNEIDRLRKTGSTILRVYPQRPNLEEIFMKLKKDPQ